MSVIIFIISLAILILVHELGHFSIAKLFGIRVDEFGLGLPPRIWGKKLGETIYSINWIPFGGFVKIFGENYEEVTEESVSDNKRSFQYKSKWIQASVLAAGIVFNLLFAWLIISLGFTIGLPAPVGYMGNETIRDAKTTIINVFPGSPADKAGLRSGDVIRYASAGKTELNSQSIAPENVSNLIFQSKSDSIQIEYIRGNEQPKTVYVVPEVSTGKRMIGIAMDKIGIIKLPIHKALYEGGKTTIGLIQTVAIGLSSFLYNAVTLHADLSQVSGPVGIAGTFGQAKELGFVFILSLVAMISINLALINLVPFPALDGGRLFFILIEAIIRRPIPPKIFNWVNGVGFALLIILMVVITGHDILKLI